jgi:hypothetical protein
VAGGDFFNPSQRHEIDKAIRDAETVSRYEFSVFVGGTEGDSRVFAESLHASLVAPARSVLIMVDPAGRAVEVVTGEEVRRYLDDSEAMLAVLSMQSAFTAGDLVGGIKRGLHTLAEHARKPRMLHAD